MFKMATTITVHKDKNQIDVEVENGSYNLADFLKLVEAFQSAGKKAKKHSENRMSKIGV